MNEQMIDPDFDRETGTLLLRLSKEEVGLGNEPVTYGGKRFQPKDEVHITVIGSGLGEALVSAMAERQGLEKAVAALIDTTGWHYELRDAWHHVVRKEDDEIAESIIRMVNVPALPGFYSRLEELTGLSIPPRPAHITLYTWGEPHGIGIATWEAFERLVVGDVEPQQLAPKRS